MERQGGKKIPRNPKEPVVRAAFARVLVERRERVGLTQAQVGDASGYEEKYIGALERRKHTPTLTAVIQISKALDISPLDILSEVLKLMPKFQHLEIEPSADD
jgi:transcriptional regulator with XRE-family HTH domain